MFNSERILMTSISFESEKRLFTIELEESKYFVKLYFISHYKAEIFLRLLSSVHKWFLVYYLWFTYSPRLEIWSTSMTFGTEKRFSYILKVLDFCLELSYNSDSYVDFPVHVVLPTIIFTFFNPLIAQVRKNKSPPGELPPQ